MRPALARDPLADLDAEPVTERRPDLTTAWVKRMNWAPERLGVAQGHPDHCSGCRKKWQKRAKELAPQDVR